MPRLEITALELDNHPGWIDDMLPDNMFYFMTKQGWIESKLKEAGFDIEKGFRHWKDHETGTHIFVQ
jgi:hypothetical protein